jgi:uncharacterized protein
VSLSASRFLLLLAMLCCLVLPARAADLAQAVAAVPNPRALDRTWVADPAGAIKARQADLNALIDGFEQETGVEIAVVVLPSIGELNPKEFATALYNHWGIGKKGKDNGVLVLQVLDQRRIEIETGYGLEGSLPDVKCHWIIEDIATPFFRKGRFSDGHYETVRALIAGVRNPDADRKGLTGGVAPAPDAVADPPPSDYRLANIDGPSAAPAADAPTSLGGLALAVLAAGLALFAAFAVQVRRHRLVHADPHAQWAYVRQRSWFVHAGMALTALAGAIWEFQGLDSFWSILSLAPGGVLSGRYVDRRLRRLREQPRLDPNTGEAMRRLDEQADDTYLKAGQVVEESIGSVDYDVWVSPSGTYLIEDYDGATPASPCPACQFKTYRRTLVRVVTDATSQSEGLAEDTNTCAHCQHTERVMRVLPKLAASSSGGSFGGGSSGGGSFGGGSSGGGGAGGSY